MNSAFERDRPVSAPVAEPQMRPELTSAQRALVGNIAQAFRAAMPQATMKEFAGFYSSLVRAVLAYDSHREGRIQELERLILDNVAVTIGHPKFVGSERTET